MWRTSALIVSLGMWVTLVVDGSAAQNGRQERSLAARQRWVRFVLIRGQLTAVAPSGQTGLLTSGSNDDPRQETFAIHGQSGTTTIRYECREQDQQLVVLFAGAQDVFIERSITTANDDRRLTYQQGRRGIEVTVHDAAGEQRYRADSIWHLLLTTPELQDELIAICHQLRPDWRIREQLAQVEQRLLDEVREQPRPKVELLVAQLADSRFAVRQAADRQLRAYGHSVLPILDALDTSRLNTEQKERLADIRDTFREPREDTAAHVAAWLVNDRQLWTSWQQSGDPLARSAAAYHLAWLNDEPLTRVNLARSPE